MVNGAKSIFLYRTSTYPQNEQHNHQIIYGSKINSCWKKMQGVNTVCGSLKADHTSWGKECLENGKLQDNAEGNDSFLLTFSIHGFSYLICQMPHSESYKIICSLSPWESCRQFSQPDIQIIVYNHVNLYSIVCWGQGLSLHSLSSCFTPSFPQTPGFL